MKNIDGYPRIKGSVAPMIHKLVKKVKNKPKTWHRLDYDYKHANSCKLMCNYYAKKLGLKFKPGRKYIYARYRRTVK